MLEYASRLTDLEGLPRVEVGTAAGFFERLRSEHPDLATWVGELYLEYHRGTLTTHADVKLANRRGEEALRAAEMWSVAAGLDRRPQLDEAWRLLLLNQFHDILPGSSIHWVYEDAAADYASILHVANSVKVDAQAAVAASADDNLVAFNASSYDRTEVITLPSGRLQKVSVPACGWAPVIADDAAGQVEVGEGWLQNDLLRVEWDDRGLLTSIRDRVAAREVIPPGRVANLFQIHEDHPKAFDAWEVDGDCFDYTTDITDLDRLEIVERDSLRCGVRLVRSFGNSVIDQTMRLASGSRRLEFHTSVEWRERHRFLKVAFPVAVRSTRATYEIQHGHIERPTIVNTTWDQARFEVGAHRWADLSEPGYGVALLNDCKYGYDIRGHVMRLSLLRAPGYPDPEADQGAQRFAYALLPHPNDLRSDGHVVEEAEAFNIPIELVPGSTPAGRIVEVDRPGVSVEAVKWADRAGGVVVRLCEVWGSRGPVRVTLHVPFSAVTRTDLLERDIEELAADGAAVGLTLRPFELVTLRFS
jgi:alpha-mannosidase